MPTCSGTPDLTPSDTPSPQHTVTAWRYATASSTVLPTATPDATMPDLSVNEYLRAPRCVGWDGDGTASADDERIELLNSSHDATNLTGWQFDDEEGCGAAPHALPLSTAVAPRGSLVLFTRQSGIALNSGGDCVRLLRPDGTTGDQIRYERSPGSPVHCLGPWTVRQPGP